MQKLTDGSIVALEGEVVFTLAKEGSGLVQVLLGGLGTLRTDNLDGENDGQQRQEVMEPHLLLCICVVVSFRCWRRDKVV